MVIVIYNVKGPVGTKGATMRVTREKAAENRERIVAAASRLFREKGFDGVGLDAIMEAAGLTHGGFYRHFGSKDDLAAEAVARGLAASAAKQEGVDSLPAFVSGYLSPRHRDDRAGGCVFAALGGDVARQGPGVRRRLTAALRESIDRIAGWIGGRRAAARQQAVATVAGLVGALVLARAVDDPALSEEILAAARKAYGGRSTPAK
jgi:TetR/AcrR family transcriptional regulator, transcriptional repressor for nem operon